MRKLIFLFACLLLAFPCDADTFINRRTGETFKGYAVKRKKYNKTQVHIEKKEPQYLNLNDYEIQYNYLGRKNKVFIFFIKGSIQLICETEAFEKAIEVAANQGPLFILIEIDTPGGRVDLTKRICAAIIEIDNCLTIAYVNGSQTTKRRRLRSRSVSQFGGAFSAGVLVALACDRLYMQEGTAIGAAAAVVQSSLGTQDLSSVFSETMAEKILSADRAYIATLAEKNGRSGLLAAAMVDKNIEVLEVVDSGKTIFIEPTSKKNDQTVLRTWSKKGSLLTLTALEAFQGGIADKVIGSQKELFADLFATRAVKVLDNDTLKARREFEIVKSKMDKRLSSISSLEKEAKFIAEELETLDKEILRDSKVYYDSYGRIVEQYNPTALRRYSYLQKEWPKVMKSLELNYKKSLIWAKKHPDFHHYVEGLKEGLKLCEK